MFCCTLLYVHSSIAIILMGKREQVALLNLSSWCLWLSGSSSRCHGVVCGLWLFVFPDHTHFLFYIGSKTILNYGIIIIYYTYHNYLFCSFRSQWGSLIFSYIRRLGSFLGFKIFNFNIFWVFQKNEYFLVGMKILWIFFSIITKLDYI